MNWKLYSWIATAWFIFGFALCGRGQNMVRVYEGVQIPFFGQGDTIQVLYEDFVHLCRLASRLKAEAEWSDKAVQARDSVLEFKERMAILQVQELQLWRERVRVEVEMKAFYEKAWTQEKRGKAAIAAKWGTIGGVVGGVVGFAGGFIVGSLR